LITYESFWKAILSHSDSCQQAEGFYTWKGWFKNKFFRIVFLKILKSLHRTDKGIDALIKELPPSMGSIANFCQLAYKFMGLLDLWTCGRNDHHCAFGAIGNWDSILEQDYESFGKNVH
jgi:hypothetical protein